MKKIVLIFLFGVLGFVLLSNAQSTNGYFNNLQLVGRLNFAGAMVTGISDDSSAASKSHTSLVTEWAAKTYVDAIGTPWKVNGNYETVAGTDFIGTRDNQDLVFKRNSNEAFRVYGSSNNFGIGTLSPAAKLEVTGTTLTGSSTTPILNLNQTWNTSGVASAINMSITNTASDILSQLLTIRLSGADRVLLSKESRVVSSYSNPSTTLNGLGNDYFGSGSGANMDLNGVDGAYHNAFFGGLSGAANTKGYQNSFFGHRAGKNNTTGFGNTNVGQGAGYENITGSLNVGVGFHAGLNIVSGSGENAIVGAQAMTAGSGSTAWGNIAMGANAARNITTGYENAVLGFQAGYDISTGNKNVLLGTRSGYGATGTGALTTGTNNIIIGYEALQSAATVSNEVTIGNSAITKFRIPALGFTIDNGIVSLATTPNTSMTATFEFLTRHKSTGSLEVIDPANFTSANSWSLTGNTVGADTKVLGTIDNYPIRFISGGTPFGILHPLSRNIGFGSNTDFPSYTTGSDNVAMGENVLMNLTTGNQNIALGQISLTELTTGNENTVIGNAGGSVITTGSTNTLIGSAAGDMITTGSANTAIGAQTEINATLVNATAIGYGATVTASNSVVIGGSYSGTPANVGIGSTAPVTNLHINGANHAVGAGYTDYGNFFISSSDAHAIDKGGSLAFGANGGSGTYPFAKISGRKETGTVDQLDGYLSFETGNNTTAPYSAERMRITSGGNVGIGESTPTSKLHVNGLVEYADNAAAIADGLTAGAFYRTGDLLKVVH